MLLTNHTNQILTNFSDIFSCQLNCLASHHRMLMIGWEFSATPSSLAGNRIFWHISSPSFIHPSKQDFMQFSTNSHPINTLVRCVYQLNLQGKYLTCKQISILSMIRWKPSAFFSLGLTRYTLLQLKPVNCIWMRWTTLLALICGTPLLNRYYKSVKSKPLTSARKIMKSLRWDTFPSKFKFLERISVQNKLLMAFGGDLNGRSEKICLSCLGGSLQAEKPFAWNQISACIFSSRIMDANSEKVCLTSLGW